MAILNQKRILNLIPKTSAPVTIHASQGDVGTEIEFTLVKGDEVFSNTGNLTALVHGVREDGANFGPFTCTLSGSKVTFPLHSEMTAVKGSALAEIVLVDNGGNKVGSSNFGILIEQSAFPLGVTYDNDVSVYESILAYVQTFSAQLNNESSARTSADSVINTRIDNIIAPSGEAPSAAEVTDARVGVDGSVYTSLGTAIRTQIGYLNDDVKYLAEDFALNEYLQNAFVLFRWNNTYGYVSNQTAMSIATIQSFPFDVKIKNLHYPNFYAGQVRIFSLRNSSPSYLEETITYDFYGDNAVSEITLPKNTYWTVQLTRPGNVSIDLATYKVIPQFVAGDNIKMASQLSLNNTLVVGKKMAPYTKIQDAVDAAQSGDTILILPGTYEEDVSAWGKELHLVGIDRDSTIIIERSGLYSKPTLEINIGSVRNLTLIETGENSSWGDDAGKGRAYTVHIESGEGYTGVGELWFDNCKIINNKHAAIGCGLYQNLHVHFNNCYMYSGRASDVTDDRYRGTFYYHTNIEANVSGQRMTVKDCEIINEDTKCFFGGVATPGADTGNVRSTFINNNFYAVQAETQNSDELCVAYSILNYHDCKLNGNSRGNNIPILNAP